MNANEATGSWANGLIDTLEALGWRPVSRDEEGALLVLPGDTVEDRRPCAIQTAAPEASPVAMVRADVLLPWTPADHVDLSHLRANLAVINDRLLVGMFECDLDDRSVHLRDSFFADATVPLAPAVVGEWLSTLAHHQTHFGDFVEIACEGSVGPDAMPAFMDAADRLPSADLV